jgi:SAM-dependent methyltransferase
VFDWLLGLLDDPHSGARALDVGCGTGRWSRQLAERGYRITGIDLQGELVERNARLHPEHHFIRSSIQDFEDENGFELVTSVTVVQHIPFSEQASAIRKLHDLLKPGGHALLLENVSDQAPHVSSRSIDGWGQLFESNELEPVAVRRYDYNPTLRLVTWMRQVVSPPAGVTSARPDEYLTQQGETPAGVAARAVLRGLQRIAVVTDGAIEPGLISRNPQLSCVHCGFLLRRPDA